MHQAINGGSCNQVKRVVTAMRVNQGICVLRDHSFCSQLSLHKLRREQMRYLINPKDGSTRATPVNKNSHSKSLRNAASFSFP